MQSMLPGNAIAPTRIKKLLGKGSVQKARIPIGCQHTTHPSAFGCQCTIIPHCHLMQNLSKNEVRDLQVAIAMGQAAWTVRDTEVKKLGKNQKKVQSLIRVKINRCGIVDSIASRIASGKRR